MIKSVLDIFLKDAANIQTPVTKKIIKNPTLELETIQFTWKHEFNHKVYDICVFHGVYDNYYAIHVDFGDERIIGGNAYFEGRDKPQGTDLLVKALFKAAERAESKQNTPQQQTQEQKTDSTLLYVRDMLRELLEDEGHDRFMRARLVISLSMINAMIAAHNNIKAAHSRIKSR